MNITIWAVRVLQTEAGLVSLCNPGAVQSKQVVVREHLDAVVVPGMTEGKVWVRGCASGSLSLFVHPWVCAFTPSEHWLPVVWSLMTSLLGCHRNTSLRVSGSAVQPCALWLNGGLWKHAGPMIWCVVVTNEADLSVPGLPCALYYTWPVAAGLVHPSIPHTRAPRQLMKVESWHLKLKETCFTRPRTVGFTCRHTWRKRPQRALAT